MAENESAEQRTEKPTPRKRRRARESGMVPYSQELVNAVVMLMTVVTIFLFADFLLRGLWHVVCSSLCRMGGIRMDESVAVTMARGVMLQVMRLCAPFGGVVLAGALLASVGQNGVVFAPKAVKWRLDVLDPVKGARRLLSVESAVRLMFDVLKLVLIGVVAFFIGREVVGAMTGMRVAPPMLMWDFSRSVVLRFLGAVGALTAVIGVVDLIFQRKRHERKLMMTKTELKEERKQEELPMNVKRRQWRRRMELAKMRMMQAVPEATVVVVNPTTYAVALKWDEKTMEAPLVVAKGRGPIAERIKQVAEEHGVPILRRRELARALFSLVEVGMEIPPQLYRAVAEVLAFVLRRRDGRRGGGEG